MEKTFTPLKILVSFLLLASPALANYWDYPALETYSYPAKPTEFSTPWYESPRGIFAIKFNSTTENPTVTSPSDVEQNTDSGKCSASINIPNASYTGNSLTWSMSGATSNSGTGQIGIRTFEKGETTIVFKSHGDSNSTAEDTMLVTVTDDEDPTISLGNAISKPTDNGQCTASIAIPNAGFSDNCSGSNISWTMSGATTGSGSNQVGTRTFNKGTTTITYTVTDAAGNNISEALSVTVTDDEDPEISLGNAISKPTDNGQCTASIAIPNAGFSDNCSGSNISWTMSGATTGSGSNQVGTRTFNKGTTTITYTVTDAAGNNISEALSVTVTDDEDPTISLGNAISKPTDNGQCTASIAIPNAGFSDNCSGSNISWTMSGATTGSGSNQVGTRTFNKGTTTITYTVTDAAGNNISEALSVTVTDDEDPTISLGNAISKPTDNGQCTASIAIPNTDFSDNCSGSSLSWTMSGATTGSGSNQVGTRTFNKGTTTITYTVTDAAGNNISEALSVTVTDDEDPTISLGNAISKPTDNGQCTASIAIPNAGFSDNCSGSNISWTMSGATTGSGSNQVGTRTFNKGTTTITYTVTDAAGNNISEALSVTVTDDEDPTISLGNAISEPTDNGQCTASIAIPNAGFSDNCSGSNISWTMSGATTGSGSNQVGTRTFNKGTTTITYTVTDAAGNNISEALSVTVTDDEDPKISLGNAISKPTDNGQCTASIAIPNAGFSDNCSGSNISWTMSGATTGSGTGQIGSRNFNIGTTTITYTVTDAANRTTTRSVDVEVTDNEDPKITLGNAISEPTDNGQCTASIAIPNAGFSDNCSGSSLSWTMSGATTGSGTGQIGSRNFNIGTTTITYTVTDAANRTTTGSVDVEVTDNEDPKITLGSDITETTDPGQCTASIAVPNAVFSDNCSGETLSWSFSDVTTGSGNGQVGTKTFNIGTTTINYIVTDAANRTVTGSIDVVIEDEEAPTPPTITTLENWSCGMEIPIPVGQDNCSGEIEGKTTQIIFDTPGQYTVTWSFTDEHENVSTKDQKVIIPEPTVEVPSINGNVYCNEEEVSAIAFTGNTLENKYYDWSYADENGNNINIGLPSSGSGDIPTFTTKNTTSEPILAVFTIIPFGNNCEGKPVEFSFTINPTPTITKPADIVVCAGETIDEIKFPGASVSGTRRDWINDNISIGLAENGRGNIGSFTATNSTSESITATITVTPSANDCEGIPEIFTITVKPKPVVNEFPEAQVYCNGQTTTKLPLESTVTGTKFNISGGAAIGLSNRTNVTEIPSYITKTGTATVTITPIVNGCTGEPVTYDVTVNPTPTVSVSPASQQICSGEANSIALSGSAESFSWIITEQGSNISGATEGTGNNIAQTLTNSGNQPQVVKYKITPEANGCTGTPVTVTVTVNPTSEFEITCQNVQPSVDLTDSSIKSSAFTGLTYTYWTNAEATTQLQNPSDVGLGLYYIKANFLKGLFFN